MAKQLIELPACAPAGDTVATTSRHGARPPPLKEPANATATGQRLLLDLLVQLQMWDELLTLAPSVYLASADLDLQARRTHALGLAHFARQDASGLAAQLQAMRQLAQQLSAQPGRDTTSRQLEYRVQLYLDELTNCAAAARDDRPNGTARLVTIGGANVADTGNALSNQSVGKVNEAFISAPTNWEPLQAPSFVLPDRNGKSISLKTFRGKPVVLVFYLGAGCPHCIEQLQTFAPLREEFESAGITVIAVSTDSIEGLKDTFRIAGAGDAIPFLLVSDQQLGTFREFGAFDRRENKPLHGTFLIDPRGRIVWQNISREPFMATRQLLVETQRVVALSEFAQRVSTPFASGSE